MYIYIYIHGFTEKNFPVGVLVTEETIFVQGII